LVAEHDFGEGFKRYEHRLSRQPEHEHLICTECGAVTEFKSREVQEIKGAVEAEYGFRASRHKLEIYGLCRSCQEKGVELDQDGLTCPIETV
jgi:Fur family transcriptional regulator, ferric uptake regulator